MEEKWVVILILVLVSNLVNCECTQETSVGTVCTLPVEKLRPTQSAIGQGEVTCKRDFLESASFEEVEQYLRMASNLVPLIIGPDGFFMVDGHHTTRALLEANVDGNLKFVYCNITYDWSHLSTKEFNLLMTRNGLFWPYDANGGLITLEKLPSKLSEISNDPFRTLAWTVRRLGGYVETNVPFADFRWANFLRGNLPLKAILKPNPLAELEVCIAETMRNNSYCFSKPHNDVTQEAFRLAQSSLASNLPGFGEGEIETPACYRTRFTAQQWFTSTLGHYWNFVQ